MTWAAVAQAGLLGFLVLGALAVAVRFLLGVRRRGFPQPLPDDAIGSYLSALEGPRAPQSPPAWQAETSEIDPDDR